MARTAYFDYQASTPLDPRVKRVMFEAFDVPGNASSEEHAYGWNQAARVLDARTKVAALIGSSSDEILFTSGATEANNIALMGAARASPVSRRRILVSSIEHKSVLDSAYAMQDDGFTVEVLPVGVDGLVDVLELTNRIGLDVAVVSIMAVNNEIGTIQPIELIGQAVRAVGAFFHVDATQAPLALEIDVVSWGVDALSLSSHKIYGPPGIGALFVALEAPWRPKPISFGGGQEGGLRPGSLPSALCVGFGEACKILIEEGQVERGRIQHMRNDLWQVLSDAVPASVLTCAMTPKHPGSLHLRIPGRSAADLLMRLQPAVAASTGSACTSGIIGPSHVCIAIGLSAGEASECLRFSIGRFTNAEDIDVLSQALRSALSQNAA